MRCAARRSIRVRPRGSISRRSVSSTPRRSRTSSRVAQSRRSSRRFVHVRLDVADIRRLGEAAPFAWSTYEFNRDGNLYVYRQTIGAAAGKDVGNVGWTGRRSSRSGCTCRARSCITTQGRRIRSAATSSSGSSRSPSGCAAARAAGRPRREDGPAVDPVPDAVAVRRHVRGGRRDVRRRDLVDTSPRPSSGFRVGPQPPRPKTK